MKVFEVNNAALVKQFLDLPGKIYKNDPHWTIQLGSDIEHVFNPKKNSLLQNGDIRRWIAYDSYNMPAGRIAAFYYKNSSTRSGIGFFESVDNAAIANALMETAAVWLKNTASAAIEGPVNFGEKDRFWGLLTSGFDAPGLYLDNYNPTYYEQLFTGFGFQQKEEILTYKVPLQNIPIEKLDRIVNRLTSQQPITFRQFDYEKINELAGDIHKIYTSSFNEETRFHHLRKEDIIQLLHLNRPVLDEKYIRLAYHGQQPIGLLAFMKDLNQTLRFGRQQEFINLKGFVVSVIPEFRQKGVELGLCHSLYHALAADQKEYILYFSGVNKQTEKMLSFLDALNSTIDKIHKTFTLNL